jgi:hypothetical protein
MQGALGSGAGRGDGLALASWFLRPLERDERIAHALRVARAGLRSPRRSAACIRANARGRSQSPQAAPHLGRRPTPASSTRWRNGDESRTPCRPPRRARRHRGTWKARPFAARARRTDRVARVVWSAFVLVVCSTAEHALGEAARRDDGYVVLWFAFVRTLRTGPGRSCTLEGETQP